MNLSPTWVEALQTMGFEAIHWSSVGDARAPDREILAASAASSPSVIQARAADVTPARLAPLVRDALNQFAEWLESGALVTVETARVRARILPLQEGLIHTPPGRRAGVNDW